MSRIVIKILTAERIALTKINRTTKAQLKHSSSDSTEMHTYNEQQQHLT